MSQNLTNTALPSKKILKNQLWSIGFDSYDNFLASDWWKMKREAIFEAKGKKCEICGSKFRVEIHHKTYQHLGNERLDDVLVVCHSCHSKIHKKTQEGEKGE